MVAGKYKRRYKPRKKYGYFGKFGHHLSHVTPAIASAVKYLNAEQKVIDYSTTAAVVSTGLVDNLNQVAEGSDYTQRTGRSIKLTSVYIRGYINWNTSATSDAVLRTLLVIDTMNQGAAPAVTDILQNADVVSPLNIGGTPGRFHVLWDKNSHIDVNGSRVILLKYFKKLNLHVKFSGTANTTFYGPTLWLIQISDQAVNPPGQQLYARMRYVDN